MRKVPQQPGVDTDLVEHDRVSTRTLSGDDAAVRNINAVEIASLQGGYRALYNPGGPGPELFPDVRCSAPGPPDREPVVIALDDPMRVSRDH